MIADRRGRSSAGGRGFASPANKLYMVALVVGCHSAPWTQLLITDLRDCHHPPKRGIGIGRCTRANAFRCLDDSSGAHQSAGAGCACEVLTFLFNHWHAWRGLAVRACVFVSSGSWTACCVCFNETDNRVIHHIHHIVCCRNC